MEITNLSGVGTKVAETLANIEIFSCEDLLLNFPRKYLDYSQIFPLDQLAEDEFRSTIARVKSVKNIFLRGRGGRSMQRAVLISPETDENQVELEAVWFNMPFTVDNLDRGDEYVFVGKIKRDKKGKQLLSAPTYERHQPGKELLHTARIVPVYRLTRGLSPKLYRRLVHNALEILPDLALPDLLAEVPGLARLAELADEHKFMLDFRQTLHELHFPSDFATLEQAQRRMAISELLEIQLILQKQRQKRESHSKLFEIGASEDTSYWAKWGFEPTADQVKAAAEILADMKSKRMYRLIQGDVGSGKTAVAGYACELALKSGKDAVIMVPTSVLAEQHYENLAKIFPGKLELVTAQTEVGKGSKAETGKVEAGTGKVEAGNGDQTSSRLYIGTQALLHRYEKLSLELGVLIVDEEHRFGVKQRELISELSKKAPHYLSMTATPIPRTMALGIFGDIEISRIDSVRKGLKPRKTFLVSAQKREDSYQWVREKLNEGELVYWICPLIEKTVAVEDSEIILGADDKATVLGKTKELRGIFSEFKVAALHGKLKSDSKNKILADFARGKSQILVSTTVIEVGIDVEAANVMFIENAERFGLAQLHQLRGRIGRHGRQGYCFLFPGENVSAEAMERLELFSRENDGIILAEYDLRSRGPGEVYGKVQSGLPNLKFADFRDEKLLELSKTLVMG